MVQFWTHKEVIFVHYCVLQFAYCAVVIAGDFDAVEVCCKIVVSFPNTFSAAIFVFLFGLDLCLQQKSTV